MEDFVVHRLQLRFDLLVVHPLQFHYSRHRAVLPVGLEQKDPTPLIVDGLGFTRVRMLSLVSLQFFFLNEKRPFAAVFLFVIAEDAIADQLMDKCGGSSQKTPCFHRCQILFHINLLKRLHIGGTEPVPSISPVGGPVYRLQTFLRKLMINNLVKRGCGDSNFFGGLVQTDIGFHHESSLVVKW
ncbi:hypothetical protein D3C75_574710 [compost metagenome]